MSRDRTARSTGSNSLEMVDRARKAPWLIVHRVFQFPVATHVAPTESRTVVVFQPLNEAA